MDVEGDGELVHADCVWVLIEFLNFNYPKLHSQSVS